MPETYNPQANTFIKRPEVKVCPACQRPLEPEVVPMSNHMNHYIALTEGAKAQVINSNEETLQVGNVTLYKKDGIEHKKALDKLKIPATPIPPVSTNLPPK